MENSPSLPYQDKPDPWSSHSVIARWVNAMPPGSVILDVGTASGTLARMCRAAGLHWRGLEAVEAWGEVARPAYDAFFIGRLEEAPDNFLEYANLVVLADILEHLADPAIQLTRLVHLQKPGILFAISVPNVANLYVRLNLLIGRFNYADRGILDRTHLRFFTRRSFKQLIEDCGLNIILVKTTPIPLALVTPFFAQNPAGRFIHRLLAILTNMMPTLLGYQFVVLAKIPSERES